MQFPKQSFIINNKDKNTEIKRSTKLLRGKLYHQKTKDSKKNPYRAFFALSTILAKWLGSFNAISANIFLSSEIPAFLRPNMNLE